MQKLARCSPGRIVLHVLAMMGDGCIRFHVAGVMREFSSLAGALPIAIRTRFAHERTPTLSPVHAESHLSRSQS